MAKYKVLSADSKHGIYEFLVDKVSDLNLLPKKTGSTALVADSGEKYICNNAKEWKALSNTGTSDSSSDSGDSAGGGVMVVTYTSSGGPAVDKTFDEIKAVIDGGGCVVARYKTSSNMPYAYYEPYLADNESVSFKHLVIEPNRVRQTIFSVDASGASETYTITYPS